MSANVRCTSDACRAVERPGIGGRRCGADKGAHLNEHGEWIGAHRYRPCGWHGQRYGFYDGRKWIGVNTDKPCPRCGGTVELISDADGEAAS